MPRRKDQRAPMQLAHDRKLAGSAHARTAMQEIAERAAFVDRNTARLRELRLAKEAQARQALETPAAATETQQAKA